MRTLAVMALLVSLGVAAPAQAATTVGNNLLQPASDTVSVCDGGPTCTVVPKTLIAANQAAGGLVAVPGVVVRWRVRSEAQAPGVSVALRVVHGETGLARSAFEVMTAQAPPIFTFATRLPVAAGDRLGVDMIMASGATSARIASGSTSAGSWDRWQPALGDGETRRRNSDKPYELLLNADIEPDADADGWGDETQDACPGAAGASGGCPPPPGAPPPGPGPAPNAGTPTGTAPAAPITPSVTPPPAVDDRPRPQITALQFNATRVRFRISEPAAVSLLVQRVTAGRRLGGRCVKPTRSNGDQARCVRLVRMLSGRTNVEPGLNTARIRRLPPGRYRVRLLSTGTSGRPGRTVVRYFRLRS